MQSGAGPAKAGVGALQLGLRASLAGLALLAAAVLARLAILAVVMAPVTGRAEGQVEPQDIVALTHHHDGLGKQVTYRAPLTAILTEADVPAGAWTIPDKQTTVLCFRDGNNAVIFTIGGEFYAANGKARQFVDFAGGDGVLLESGRLVEVRELEAGLHPDLRQAAIDTGLKLCGQKSLEATSEAVEAAAEKPGMTPHQAAMLEAALAIRGAELCRFKLDEVAVVDHLQASDIDLDTYKAEIPVYSLVVTKMFSDVGEKDFCHTVLLPRFGPDGRKFVSE